MKFEMARFDERMTVADAPLCDEKLFDEMTIAETKSLATECPGTFPSLYEL